MLGEAQIPAKKSGLSDQDHEGIASSTELDHGLPALGEIVFLLLKRKSHFQTLILLI